MAPTQAGNEDRVSEGAIYPPHAKTSGPQPATKCVFNLLNQTASWHYIIIFMCVYECELASASVCVSLWDLMDFFFLPGRR